LLYTGTENGPSTPGNDEIMMGRDLILMNEVFRQQVDFLPDFSRSQRLDFFVSAG